MYRPSLYGFAAFMLALSTGFFLIWLAGYDPGARSPELALLLLINIFVALMWAIDAFTLVLAIELHHVGRKGAHGRHP